MVIPDFNRTIAQLFTLIYLLLSPSAWAAFQASVDRNPVAEGESFTLMLKSDESLDEDPDLSVLQQDFDVLGKSSGSSMQIINGRVSRSIQWQISLMPKHTGPSVIPAIKAGGQSTQAIVIGVTKVDQAKAAQQSGELFVEVSAEPRTAYVQQQIIFIVRLYRTVNIGNDSTLSDPKFPDMDAIVERLGEDRIYQTTRNGQTYAVIERRYAVYPQKSGSFSSAPVQFDGVIIENTRGRGGFMFDPFGQITRQKRVNSQTLPFTIKPVSAVFGSAQWLPAAKLQLSEQWSENPPKFIAGEPVTRTLVISASGLTASQLPALGGQAIDGFKLYPDQPVFKDNKGDNGVSGVRTQKIAIMPTHPGSFILPAIEVQWWNVSTDRMEVARLPAKTITVLAGSASTVLASPSPALTEGTMPAEPGTAKADISLLPGNLELTYTQRGWWPWVSLFLGVGWLVTLILWRQAHKQQSASQGEAGNGETLGRLQNRLKKACLSNDAEQAKSSLLAWAKLRWHNNPPVSLTAMAGLCEPALANTLRELDRALYSQGKGSWLGEELWRIFSALKPEAVGKQAGKEEALEPLFQVSQ